MSRNDKSGAIWLRSENGQAIVCVEHEGQWIEIIREHLGGPFSHVAEPSGIENQIGNQALADALRPFAIAYSEARRVNGEPSQYISMEDYRAAFEAMSSDAGLEERLRRRERIKRGLSPNEEASLPAGFLRRLDPCR